MKFLIYDIESFVRMGGGPQPFALTNIAVVPLGEEKEDDSVTYKHAREDWQRRTLHGSRVDNCIGWWIRRIRH